MDCLSSMVCPSVSDEQIEFFSSVHIETLMDFLTSRDRIIHELRVMSILVSEITLISLLSKKVHCVKLN